MRSSRDTMRSMITAVVLTHNNEDSIRQTLQSITFCDERIVVDDFSTDTTVSLAKKNNATVLSRRIGSDFASQRNFALRHAKGNWVLFIDSDEIVTQKLQKEILSAVESPHAVGYYFKRTDVLFGKELRYGETGSVRLLRLAKRDAGVWRGPVHEVWDIHGPTAVFSQPLIHHPHPNITQFLDDINRYSTLYARYLFQQKKREPVWYVVVWPALKFFRNYVLKSGYLDGTPGIIVAIMMSFHSFLVRAKLRMLWQTQGDST